MMMQKRPRIAYLAAILCAALVLICSCSPFAQSGPEVSNGSGDANYPSEGGSGIAAPDVEGELSTPLMWRVASPDGKGEIYLLGSIHLGYEDTCLFPDEVYAAFDSCDNLVSVMNELAHLVVAIPYHALARSLEPASKTSCARRNVSLI